MTLVQFSCPYCHSLFQIDDSLAGQQVACPTCGGLLTVPGSGPPLPPDFPPAGMPRLPPDLPTDVPPPPPAGYTGEYFGDAPPLPPAAPGVWPAPLPPGFTAADAPMYGEPPPMGAAQEQPAADLFPPGFKARSAATPVAPPEAGQPARPAVPLDASSAAQSKSSHPTTVGDPGVPKRPKPRGGVGSSAGESASPPPANKAVPIGSDLVAPAPNSPPFILSAPDSGMPPSMENFSPPAPPPQHESPPDLPPPAPDLTGPPEPPLTTQPSGVALPLRGVTGAEVFAGAGPTTSAAPRVSSRPVAPKPAPPAVDAKGAPILDTTKKVKLVGTGAMAREVREFSPEERERRRRRRSLAMMVVGLLVLAGAMYLLMQF